MQSNRSEYTLLFTHIKERIRLSQYAAMKTVNKQLIDLYWNIGQAIVEKQRQCDWGRSVVENLAIDLKIEFPGARGYSANNLWCMRQFYLEYHKNLKLQPLVGEISWSKHLVIMAKCKDDVQREFYIKMTMQYGWTKNVLIHQIEGKNFERSQLNQTNFNTALDDKYKDQATLAVKDRYIFDFLEISTEFSEREMELSLIKNIRQFLLEMGGDFAYIGNQYQLVVGGDEFSIDLLLFHRKLRALVAIDLKIKKFKPSDIGQLQFYLTTLDEQVKEEHEAASIGIIICKEKNRTVVEYALRTSTNPMGVSTYAMSNELPVKMRPFFPSPQDLIKSLEAYSIKQ